MPKVHCPTQLFHLKALIIIYSLLVPAITFGQSANDAILALKKLEARVETGISYKDYAPVLGETKYSVKLFLDSSEAKENPELAFHIKSAMQYFEIANFIWEYKYRNRRVEHFIPKDDDYGKLILEKFPDIEIHQFGIYISDALSRYWNEASKEIQLGSNAHENLNSKTTTKDTELEKINKENASLRKENEKLKAENEKIKKDLQILKKGR